MKKIFNTIRKMKQVLFALILVFGFLTSYSQELGYYDFPYTGSGYTITFTGSQGAYGGSYAGACGADTGCKGNAFSMNGYSGGVSVTFNFSSAVNNVVIRQGAINAGNVTAVSTNGGALSFSASGPTCGHAVYNNSASTVSWPDTGSGYNDENFKVTAASSFTTMTINVSGDYTLLTLDMGGVAATPPSEPTAVSANPATICSGSGTNLTATAGSGNTVYWYSGSCGGTYLGTGNITVYPTISTTYYARNYNGQYSASCGSTSVTVNNPATAPTAASGAPTGTTTANLAFSGATGGTPTYYWVIGTSPSVADGSGVDQGNTTGTTASTSALAASTTYYLRVRSNNGTCGNSAYYTSSSFRTSSVINYTAGANGSLTGTTSQTIANTGTGTAVTAVPNANYHFVNWSDGSTTSPRIDSNVTNSTNLTANFAANKLVFGTQPGNSIAGAAIPITVRITKTDGTTITSATNSVTISIQSNPNSGTLAGTLTRATVAGVATFDDVWINKTGVGYTIKAICDAPSIIVTQPISTSFNITPATLKYFTVEGITTPVVAGTTTSPTVKVYDIYDNLKTNYTGTIAFSSTDSYPAVLPSNYTFLPGDNGVKVFANGVILKRTGNQTVTVTGDTKTGSQSAIHVDPDVITHFNLVVNDNNPVMAGVPFSSQITVRDRFENVKTDFVGENLIWTTNAISSPNGTPRFLPNNGPQTFTEGVAKVSGFIFYNSAQTPYLSVSDGATSSVGTHSDIVVVNNQINNFLVESGTGTLGSFSPGTSMVAGTPFSVKVTARDIYWNTHITYDGIVRFKTSDDTRVHVPANYTYNASEHGIHVFANSTTIHETGAYWMRVGEGAALAKSGIQEGIVVDPGTFSQSQSTLVLVPSTPTSRTAGDHVQVEFTPKDAYGNLLCVATGDKTIKLKDSGTDDTNDYDGSITENILKVASLATGSFSSSVRVTKAGTNTITAWYEGAKFSTDITIDVSPAETSYYTINNVTSIIAGETRAAYTVSRYDFFGNLQKSGNETITLSSNATGPNEKFYPAADGVTPVTTVTLANGSGTVNFWYYDEKAGDWSISATGLSGISAITDAITVIPGATNHFHLTSPADITAGGSRAAYTITRHDQFSNEVYAGNQTVYLYSTSTGVNKKFYTVSTGGAPTSSISIAGNSSTANFWYYDEKTSFFGTDGSGIDAEWTITASDVATTPNGTDSGIIDGTDGIKVLPTTIANAPNSFEITTTGTTSYYGDPQTITVKAMDTYGNVKTNYTGFIKFSNTDTQATNPAENQTLVNGSKTFTDGVIFSAISSGPEHWWLTVLNPSGMLFGGKTFVVLPRPITITAGSNQTKTYGDTKDLGSTAFSVTSSLNPVLKAGESITGVTLVSPGTPASANVGDYDITPSGATGTGGFLTSNYAITYSTAGKLTVNPAELIVTANTDQTKVYGQSDPTFTYTVSGFKNGQTASIITGSLSRVSGENAGNYAIGLGTLSAGNNYTITFVPANFSITRKDIAINVTAAQSKIYGDTDPTFAFTTTPDLNALPFTLKSWSGRLSRLTGENVGSYAIAQGTLELSDANSSTSLTTNYNVTYTGADFSITRKDIAIDVTVEQSKIYGETDPTFAFTTTPALTDLPYPEKSWSGGLVRAIGQNVGSYAISKGPLELSDVNSATSLATNYNVTYTGANFSITRKDIAINVTAEQSKIYGDADPTFEFTTSPALTDLPFPEKSWSGGLVRAIGQNVGSYAISKGTLELSDVNSSTSLATNYNVTYTGANFSITRKDIEIDVTAEQSKIYGEADPTFEFTTTPVLSDLPFPVKSWTGGLTRANGQNVGSYAIAQGTLELGDANSTTSLATNYHVTFNSADFSITRKDITINVNAEQSKIYGAADPAFTFTTSPALADLPFPAKSWAGALSRAAGENVDSYAIAQGTLDLSDANSSTSLTVNYHVTFNGTDFSITRKAIAINVNAEQSKIYGASDPTFTFTVNPALTDLPFPVKSWTGALSRAAGQNVGSYAITRGTLELTDNNSATSLATNYDVTYTGADFSITRKDIAIDVTVEQSKIYGETDPTFAFTTTPALTDLPYPEKSWSGGLVRAIGQNVGSYAISKGTLELSDANSATSLATNYNVTYTGANFSITRKDIAINVTAEQSKIYGETDPTFKFTTSPALADLQFPTKSWAGALSRAAGENVDSYAIAQGNIELSDANSATSLATNYHVTFTGANFSITRKEIAINVIAEQSKIYGATDPTFAFTTSPALADLPFPAKSWAGALSRAAGENVGSYAIAQGNIELSDVNSATSLATNYHVTFTGANFSITRKEIAINVNAEQSKIYGAADPAFTFTTSPALADLPFPVKSWAGALSRAAGENVNSYAIAQGTLELADANSETSLTTNYHVTFTGADFSITRKDIAINVNAEQSKIYGDADPIFGFTTTPALGALPFPTKSWTGALSRASGENVDSYAIAKGTLELADANSTTSLATNYHVTFTSADFSITPRNLNITATAKSKSYGTLLTSGAGLTAFTSVGLQNNEEIGSVTLTYGTGAEALALPNTYTGSVTPSAATGGTFTPANYTISYVNGDIIVDKAVLKVTADAKSKTYDGSGFSPFTSTITGFVNGETISNGLITGLVQYSGNATTASDAGSYTITPIVSDLSAANYSFVSVNGSLYINTETIYVSAVNKEKSLGDTDPVLTYTYSSQLNGIDIFSGKLTREAGDNLGTYRILKGSLSLNYNYDISFQEGTFLITDHTVPLWVTASNNLNRTIEYHDAAGLTTAQALAPVASDNDKTILTKVAGQFVKQGCDRNGTYTNTWTAKDVSGNTSIVYTQVITIVDSPTEISGTVSSSEGLITSGVQVILLSVDANNQTSVVDQRDLTESSSFAFTCLSSGSYLLKAVVTDAVKYPNLLNSYYNGSGSAITATRIDLGSSNNTGIQLVMLQKTLGNGGGGSILGQVIRKEGPANRVDIQVGQAVPGIDVVLKQGGKIVLNTTTNLEGKYTFTSLPLGSYIVEAEELGYTLDVVKKVTIVADTLIRKDVNFTIWTSGTITEVEDLGTVALVNMYPNPTTGQLNIVSSKDGYTTITVFSTSGKEIFRKNYLSGEAIKIDLSNQVSGIYFVKLESEGESVTKKIILKK